MDPSKNDVRIKMCMTPTEEDLFTVYHELGHVYYYLHYNTLPNLFRSGANDGFHEAIGDTVNLSVTPGYLAKIGLISPVKPSEQAVINQQMKIALDKIAFLPFGRLIDQWRWKVFSGRDHARPLQRRRGGSCASTTRASRRRWRAREADFDPGAKYHIPDNTPYTRYFLSYILQFQFHKALCDASGFKGPLHECSVFGSKEAGQRFAADAGPRARASPGRMRSRSSRARARSDARGDHRVLPAADGVAEGAEPGPAVRLGVNFRLDGTSNGSREPNRRYALVRLLLIEDDEEAAHFILKGLRESGYTVDHAADGRDGLFRATETDYDVIITDRMLPHLDGLAIVQLLRQQGRTMPVLVLSALGTVDDRVKGLRAGGDDYLTKPFAFAELLARVEALLRRKTGPQATTVLRVADLELDLLGRRAIRAGKELDLTAREFTLLEFLVRRTGQVVTRTMLLEGVWDLQFDPQTNLVDVHISRLRQAVDKGFDKPLIHTVRGAGYIVRDE